MPAKTASNLNIARRAEARARADLATWQMMDKLRSTDALPQEAQAMYAGYAKLRARMSEAEAEETTIRHVYLRYYASMGGTGTPPDLRPMPRRDELPDNVTPFRRIVKTPDPVAKVAKNKRLPVALIFILLATVVVLLNYAWRAM